MTATDVSSTSQSLVQGNIDDYQLSVAGAGLAVHELVANGWTAAQEYASSAFTAAQTFLDSLGAVGDYLTSIPTIDSNLAEIETGVAALTSFAAVPPTFTPTLSFTDADYTSPELTHLIDTLDDWVLGAATGLPAAVEQAIWDRGRAREAVASNKKAQEVMRQFAGRGFSKPPGALAVQLLEAAQQATNNDVTLSRDIAIKQADLEQSNRRFAFEQAEKIQQALMNYMQDKQRRALEAARALMQALVDTFGTTMQGYSATAGYQGQLAGAQASLIRANADVQIATANIRIEAAKANVQALIQKATVLAEALRAGAQVSSQVAAAALAAVNLSGGLSHNASDSASISDSRSRSIGVAIGSQSNRQENYTP